MITQKQPTLRQAGVMAFVAATLAVASILHFTTADGGAKPFSHDGAAIAEAIICIVLLAGSAIVVADPVRGRGAALAATGFAIFGFIVGLSFTLRGGAAADVIYHLTMLPVLILTLVQLLRTGSARER